MVLRLDRSNGDSGGDEEVEPARVWTQENTDSDIPDFTGEAASAGVDVMHCG